MAARLFDARYDGTCGECGDEFEAGDSVGYTRDDVLVCAGCLDNEPADYFS